MNDLLTIKTQGDNTLQEVFKGRPYLTNIEGSINICMTLCGQDIDGCSQVEFVNMKNYEKILVCNPNPNQPSTCNIQLAFDSTSDNINDDGIGKYTFEKMFITVPSMHKLNGQIYDVEVYLLYSSTQKNGEKLYVCMCSFFQGTDSISNQDWKLVSYKLMNELFSKASKIPNRGQTLPISAPPNPVDINDFLPIEGFRNFYEYTHPSNTKVNFRIFQTPLLVSNVVLKNLRDKLTPGILYNNMKQMIENYRNPPDGVFIFFSQDFTKSVDSALQGQLLNPSLKSCPPQKKTKKSVKKTGKKTEKPTKKTGKSTKKTGKSTQKGGKKKKKEKFTSEHFQNESDDEDEEEEEEDDENEVEEFEDEDDETEDFENDEEDETEEEFENDEEEDEDENEDETQKIEEEKENENYKNKAKTCKTGKSAPLDEMTKTKNLKTYTIFALIFMVIAPILLFVSISKILNDPSFEGLGNYLPDENKILQLLNNSEFRILISQKVWFYVIICIQIILTIITSLFMIISKNNQKSSLDGFIYTIIIFEILAFIIIGFYTKQRINIGLSNYDVSELDYSIFSMKLGLWQLLKPSTPISSQMFSQLNFNTNQQFSSNIQKGGAIGNNQNRIDVLYDVPPVGKDVEFGNIHAMIKRLEQEQEPMDNKTFIQDYGRPGLIYCLYYGWILVTLVVSSWLLVKVIEFSTKFFSTSGIKTGLSITIIIAFIIGFIGIITFNIKEYLPLSSVFSFLARKSTTSNTSEDTEFKPVSPEHRSRSSVSFETSQEQEGFKPVSPQHPSRSSVPFETTGTQAKLKPISPQHRPRSSVPFETSQEQAKLQSLTPQHPSRSSTSFETSQKQAKLQPPTPQHLLRSSASFETNVTQPELQPPTPEHITRKMVDLGENQTQTPVFTTPKPHQRKNRKSQKFSQFDKELLQNPRTTSTHLLSTLQP